MKTRRVLSTDKVGGFLRWAGMTVFCGAILLGTARRSTASTTFTVTSAADPAVPPNTTTLRGALGAAASGDTINFNLLPGTKITLNGTELAVTQSVTITGPGAANLTIDGANSSRIFNVSGAAVTISGLKLKNGNNTTGYGGGINFTGATGLTLDAVTITNCVNYRLGTGTNATVRARGGAIYAGGPLTLQNGCVISGNSVTGTTPGNDYTKPCGGGIFAANATTIKDSTISGNTCTASGVASATLFNEARGGGIYSNYQISIQNSTISGNTVSVPAGPSKAYIYGAGLVIYAKGAGPSTIQNCTISGNSATAASTRSYFSGGRGGAMYVSFFSTQPLSLQNCTISGNTIASSSAGGTQRAYGGAMDIGSNQPLYLKNCTVAYNVAKNSSGLAGGIFVNGSSTVTLTSTIIAKNTHNSGAPVPDDLLGSTFAGTYNLIGNGSGSNLTNGVSNQVGTAGSPIDPKLGALRNNNGPTQTHALLSGSPAINAGINTPDIINGPGNLITDQRGTGFRRDDGNGVDIGAFEFHAPSGKVVTDPGDSGLPNDLRTVLTETNEGDTISFAPSAGTTITLNGTQLNVEVSVSITGPGASNLTIDGNNASRVFYVGGPTVTISGLTLAHGANSTGFGGGISTYPSSSLTLDGVTITNCANSVTGTGFPYAKGGAIYAGGPLTLKNGCVISGNSATATSAGYHARAFGGGISAANVTNIQNSTISGNTVTASGATGAFDSYARGGGIFCGGTYSTISIRNSTISNNTATTATPVTGTSLPLGGGLYLNTNGASMIQNCTISGNRAVCPYAALFNTQAKGGGLYAYPSNQTLSLQNCTISGNSTDSGGSSICPGGGIFKNGKYALNLANCTIVNNVATSATAKYGGGIYDSRGPIVLTSTIVAKNTRNSAAPVSDDIMTRGAVGVLTGSTNNLIGDGTGQSDLSSGGPNANQVGSAGTPIDPLISPLQNNGGPTQTHELLAGSPAINAGLNTNDIIAIGNPLLSFDQRGTGFNRQVGAAVDIGAVEREDITPPTAAIGSAPNVTAAAITYAFTVVFSDNKTIDISTLGNGNIKVTGPNGFSQLATFVSSGSSNGNATVTATYKITPPGGAWTTPANGTYTIALQASQVADTFGNFAVAGALSTFNVNVDTVAPTAAIGSAPNVSSAATQYTFTIVFNDNVAMDPSTISSNGNLLVTGPNSFSQLANFVSANPSTPSPTITATYAITPPGGAWSPAANGLYSIALLAHKTADTSGNFVAAGTLGSFFVAVSATPATLSLTSGPTATPSSAGIGESIQFSAAASLTGTSFAWNFGDGSTDTGATVSHAFASAGTFTVTVTATNGTQSVTGTVIVTISAPAFGSGPDSNGDGFSDAFDTAFGLNPADPTQSPVPAGTPAGNLTAAKLKVTLSFGKPNSDSLSLSGTLPIPAGFKINGARIGLSAGDLVEVFTLGANGKGKVGGNAASVSIKATKGTVSAQSAKYSITLKKDSLAVDLLSSGLVNDTVKNKAVVISVGVVLSQADRLAGVVEEGTLTLHYTATKGKVGSAK